MPNTVVLMASSHFLTRMSIKVPTDNSQLSRGLQFGVISTLDVASLNGCPFAYRPSADLVLPFTATVPIAQYFPSTAGSTLGLCSTLILPWVCSRPPTGSCRLLWR